LGKLVARPHACITCASRVLEHSRPLIAQGCDRLVSKSGVHDADVPRALLIPSYSLSWLDSLVMRQTKNRSALRHIGRTSGCFSRRSTGVNGRMLEVGRLLGLRQSCASVVHRFAKRLSRSDWCYVPGTPSGPGALVLLLVS
jgi:hypothetical protein